MLQALCDYLHWKDLDIVEQFQRKQRGWSDTRNTSPIKTGWAAVFTQRRRSQGQLRADFQYLKGTFKKAGEGLSTRAIMVLTERQLD